MYTKKPTFLKGRPPIKSIKRRNLLIAYLFGLTDVEFKIKVGKLKKMANRIDIVGEEIEKSRYKAAIAEKFFFDKKGNRRTILNRVIEKNRDWFYELTKTEIINEIGELDLSKKAKKFLIVNIDKVKDDLKSQTPDNKLEKCIDWFFEPKIQDDIKKKRLDYAQLTHYYQIKKLNFVELKRFYLFKEFYDFTLELYQLRKKPISFAGLFNAYLLHMMYSTMKILVSNKKEIEEMSIPPLLIWKSFGDTFDEGYLFAFGAFTFDRVESLFHRMDSYPQKLLTNIFNKCNEYFTSLLKENINTKIPQTINTFSITDDSLKFLQKLKEAKDWSKIFQ